MTAPILLPLAFGRILSLGESLEFQFLGALVVFTVLGLLWGMLELSGLVFRRLDEGKRSVSLQSGNQGSGRIPAERSVGIPEEIMVVVAAAVHVTCKEQVRILSVQPTPSESISQLSLQAWTVEGRRQIFDSRRVR